MKRVATKLDQEAEGFVDLAARRYMLEYKITWDSGRTVRGEHTH